MTDPVLANRALWDEWTEVNFASAFYDVAGFVAGASPLDAEVLAGIGDVTGKRVLHLQCHFGMDTLRLGRLAREVVGVDFSPRAIARANELRDRVGATNVRFVEHDVRTLALGETFDLVFTSYGVLGWLPELAPWAKVVAAHLAPGGRLFLIEGHPTMFLFDGDADPLRVTYPYFARPTDPIVLPRSANYADPTAVTTSTEYSFPHDLGETFQALLGAGLRIDDVREYRHAVWRALACLVETTPGRFEMPPDRPELPLMFSVTATR